MLQAASGALCLPWQTQTSDLGFRTRLGHRGPQGRRGGSKARSGRAKKEAEPIVAGPEWKLSLFWQGQKRGRDAEPILAGPNGS